MRRAGLHRLTPHSVPLALALSVVMLISAVGLIRSPVAAASSPFSPLAGTPTITVHHAPGPTVYLTGSGFVANGQVRILVFNATAPTFFLKGQTNATNASGEFNDSLSPFYMSTLGNGTYTFLVNDNASPEDIAQTAYVWSNGTYHLTLSASVALPGANLTASGSGFSGVLGSSSLSLGNLSTFVAVNSSFMMLSNGTFINANFTIPENASNGLYAVIAQDPYGDVAFALLQVGSVPSEVNVTFVTVPSSCELQFGSSPGTLLPYANDTWSGPVPPVLYSIAPASCAGEVFSDWGWSGTSGAVTDPTVGSTSLEATSNGTLTATFTAAPGEFSVTFATFPSSCTVSFNGTTYANGQSDTVPAGSYSIMALGCTGATFSSWSSSVGAVVTPSASSTAVAVNSTGTLTATYTTSPTTYLVTFSEAGLPAGTDWSVLVDSTSYSSTTAVISFSSPNMAYSAGIPAPVTYDAVYVPTPTQSPNYAAEGSSSCPGLPVSNSFCGELIVAGASLLIQVNFTGIWQLDWVPARDSYSFTNPVDVYSDGNCYGYSQTEVLYWLHDVEGLSSDPYLPLQPSAATSTSDLKWDQANLNNASLAITVHQILDPENHGDVLLLQSSSFDEATQFAQLVFDVQTEFTPTVIAMGEPHASGTDQDSYHAVVVYGMTQFLNGTYELNISDPNHPGIGVHGWYTPSTQDFYYYGYAAFRQFVVADLHPLDSSYLDGESLLENYDSNAYPDFFVLSDGPVTLATVPVVAHGLVLQDSFGDNGAGNSQTFEQGIPRTSGIEEGAIQAYGLPHGTWFTIDPSLARSDVLVVQSVNLSGTNVRYGMGVGTDASETGNYNLTPNSDGFNLTSSAALSLKNLSFYYRNGTTQAALTAYNLSFPAGDTERLTVESWGGLNSTTVPSVTLSVFPVGATTPSITYQLVNGEDGLPSAAPTSSPQVSNTLLLYAGLASVVVVAIAVGVIVVYRRRGKKGNSQ
jgi:hypothetical protein